MRIILYALVATIFFFIIYGIAYLINKIEYNSIRQDFKKNHNDSSSSDNNSSTFTYKTTTTITTSEEEPNKKKYKKI